MRERDERQTNTLKAIAHNVRQTDFTNARARSLKKEILAHEERVLKLTEKNREAKFVSGLRRRGPKFTKHSFREKHLIPLSRNGRKIARDHPELASALKVPHKNASVAEVADAADRMADALTPYQNLLIKAGYKRGYLKTLRKEAGVLRERAENAMEARSLLRRSNRELTDALSRARDTIDELDSVLRSLDNYSDYKIRWEIANRVGARMGRPSKRRLAAQERSAARAKARDD